ncbi:restriction endonuclease subunit S [Candidatus Wolfebacteria bacterium]|nr:restriction endonuclease subunit S [Candidatus Wolfebacteria bacterium]
MFNHLKNGGKCAVVVSEGFLTWDSEPAKEMRKIILEEANLKAIISLPQGLFVSKGGQGAKTSILYFEKSEPTKNVWFYKITNDGYSMGVNRNEIAGCQIPEALELFTKYVKHGKIPPKTKNSFVIPADWIKQIDPRLKERIIIETTAQQKEKFSEKRKKEIGKFDDKLKKGEITKKEHEQKCWQFDNIVENSIQNEITKLIEKAHSYSFNLQNYRNSLSDDQIKKWKDSLSGIKTKNSNNIDTRYQELLKADSKTTLQILASFNTESALEMDIAREYLSKLEKKDESMRELEEILRENNKYPLVPLNDLLMLNENKIKPKKYKDEQFVILGVSNTGGVFVNEKKNGSEIDQSYFVVENNQFCYNPYRINVGSVGLNNFENNNRQIISGAYVIFGVKENEIDPRYLLALLKTESFNKYVNEQATGGVRMNFKFEYLQNWQIPLPPLEIQLEIVEKIERQKAIIEGAEKILGNWKANIDFTNYSKMVLKELCVKITQGPNPKYDKIEDDGYKVLKTKDLYSDVIHYENSDNISKKVYLENKNSELQDKDILIAIVGQGSIGKVNVFYNDGKNKFIFTRALGLIRADESKIIPEFIKSYLLLNEGQKYIEDGIRGTSGQLVLKTSYLKNLAFPLPPIEIQKQIVAKLDKEMEALENVRELKNQAENRINKILQEVWDE